MQKALLARTRPEPARPSHHRATDTRHHSLHPASPERRTDDQFASMLEAYRDSGGIARTPEVLALFRRNYGPDHSTLAKWVASRQVLCFEWQAQAWFPWFQFDRRSLLPQPQLRPVLDELTPIYDPWQLAGMATAESVSGLVRRTTRLCRPAACKEPSQDKEGPRSIGQSRGETGRSTARTIGSMVCRRATAFKPSDSRLPANHATDWRKAGHLTEPSGPHTSACKVAGIDGMTLHGLRRSFKSLTEWLEIPAGVVAQLMGHKPSATAEKHYTVRPLELLAIHHEKIEAWILEQAGIVFDTKAALGALRVVKA